MKRTIVKTIVNCFAIGLAGSLSVGAFSVRADLEVSGSVSIRAEADFYAPLTPHGGWIEVNSYGRCWRPAEVAVGWRPYCYGHWIWTDCGWYWASDEPWAWACYHYGSWVYDPVYHWVWVPGIEWAPAWVSWRFGEGYCGWAPLAPHGVVAAPALFVFVEARHFHEPVHPRTVIVNNTTIVNKTTVVNNISHEMRAVGGATPQKVIVNNGPGLDPIQKATGKKISAVPIQQVAQHATVPAGLPRKASEPARKEPVPAPETPKPPGQHAPPDTPSPSPKEEVTPP